MSAQLCHGTALTTVPIRLHSFDTANPYQLSRYVRTALAWYSISYCPETSAQLWHGKAIAIISDWVLVTTLPWLYATKLPTPTSTTNAPAIKHPVHVRHAVRTALALQHPAHVRLSVRASNHIDPPPRLSQCTIKTGTSIYQPRPTPATRNDRPVAPLRLDRPQLSATIVWLHLYDLTNISYPQHSSRCTSATRPTPATCNDRPPAAYDSAHISYKQRSSLNRSYQLPTIPSRWRDKYNYHEPYTHACKIGQ